MKNKHRLLPVLLLALGTLLLLLESIIFWFHWFLPEPEFVANSYQEVINKEIFWGIRNVIFQVVLLFTPLYMIISNFIHSNKSKITVVVIITVLLGSIFTSRQIYDDFRYWLPLENTTRNAEQSSFELGRTQTIPIKQYTVYFTQNTTDYSFLREDILNNLEELGYIVNDFGISVGNQYYSSVSDPTNISSSIINIEQVPFETKLERLDYASINLYKAESVFMRGSLHVLINNYEGNGMVSGMVRTSQI